MMRNLMGSRAAAFVVLVFAALGWAALSLGAPAARAGPTSSTPASLPSLAEPTLSPDGSRIAFASGGDIWEAPSQGGEAHLLVTDPATESRPLYSPDGRWLAFQSTRNGAPNIYLLELKTGAVRRLTYADAAEQLDAWSPDGRFVYFTSTATDVGRQGDILRVSVEGGTPLEVSRERYLNEFSAAPSPDGRSIALAAKGIASVQWWRHGHSHIDETELWLKPLNESAGYRLLAPAQAKHLWPMWRPDGRAIWFMSDEGGAENIWRLDLDGGRAVPVTRFTEGRVLWPQAAADGSAIVFERDFRIWRLDPASGRAAPVEITLRGAPAGEGTRHLDATSFSEMALSPDGKKVAVIAHGELFAASIKEGGPAQRITHSPAAEREPVWTPDSRRLIFVSETGPDARLMLYDFASGTTRALGAAAGEDARPVVSPDGKRIAWIRNQRELHVLTLSTGRGSGASSGPDRDQKLYVGALGYGGGGLAWSPDGQWLAFSVTDRRAFTNVDVIPSAGGEAQPISFLADGETSGQIVWSPDGKFLIFDSGQRAESSHLVRVDLTPHTPRYREDAFRELFKPASPGTDPAHDETPGPRDRRLARSRSETPEPQTQPATQVPATEPGSQTSAEAAPASSAAAAAKKPPHVQIVFEGIRERASFLPISLDAQAPVISPDGKTLVFRAGAAGGDNLYSYSLDELSREPPSPQALTADHRRKSGVAAFSPDSKSIAFLGDGVVNVVTLEGDRQRSVAIDAEMDVDFDSEKPVVFQEAWDTLNHRFFDPTFHGQDWAALKARFAPYAAGARTSDELRRDILLMIGELNASHSGIARPASGYGAAPKARVGDLGLRFEREPYEAGKGLRIREVVPLGPAALEGAIRPGDTLSAVNGTAIGPHTNLDQLLLDQIGKRTVLGVTGAKGGAREAVVRPVSPGVAAGLLYRAWVNSRRAYVERISGGRLGYVHIADMGDQSLNQLHLDLDAQNEAREGVVVDVRNNNGGYVNGRVLDIFSRREFLQMTPRGLFGLPSRQALGQRALGLPTVLVTNESSLSDAEDFTQGYRELGLGKVVGQPTAGWIIYTGAQTLIDGSVLRVPFIRIQTAAGDDMEMHPRPVDVAAERALGETETGEDAQLAAAVETLLGQIGPLASGKKAP